MILCLLVLSQPLSAQEPELPALVLRPAYLDGSPYIPWAVSSDRKTLVLSGRRQGLLLVVEADSGKQLCALNVTKDQIERVQLFPDDQTLLAADHRRVFLWNLKTYQKQATCPDPNVNPELELLSDMAVTGDGSTLVTFYKRNVSHKEQFTFQVWDPVIGRKLGEAAYPYPLTGATAKHRLALSHDGKRLAIFQHDQYKVEQKETAIHFWDLVTQQDGRKAFKERPATLTIPNARVTQIKFHPQGNDFVVTTDEVYRDNNNPRIKHFLLLYSFDSLQKKRSIEVDERRGIGRLVFSREGKLLTEYDSDHARVWDTTSWQLCLHLSRDINEPRWPELRRMRYVGNNQVEFDIEQQGAVGRWLIDLQQPGQFSTPPLPVIKKLPMALTSIASMQLSSDQKQLYAVDAHGWMNQWDMTTRQLVKGWYPGHPYKPGEAVTSNKGNAAWFRTSATLSPDAKYLLREGNGMNLLLTQLATGVHRLIPLEIEGKIEVNIYVSTHFSHDNQLLLIEWYDQGQKKHMVQMWETGTGKMLWNRGDIEYTQSFFQFEQRSAVINSGAMVLDAKSGRMQKRPGVAYPLNVEYKNEAVRQLPQNAIVHSTSLLPDERSMLVLLGSQRQGEVEMEVQWVERFTREVRRSYALPSHEQILWPRITADGKRILAVDDVADIYFWNLYETDAPQKPALTPDELKRHWATLGQQPAGPAWHAMLAMMGDPSHAIPFLTTHFKPDPNLTNVAQLIADLDHADFARREKASSVLRNMKTMAQSALEEAVQSSSLERSRRAGLLLQSLSEIDLSFLRLLRVIELLERLNTPEAIQLLEQFGNAPVPNPLTEEARAALLRLQKS